VIPRRRRLKNLNTLEHQFNPKDVKNSGAKTGDTAGYSRSKSSCPFSIEREREKNPFTANK
jgi:hypothetical protein